jgi:beta-lactamase regulating signal transducer with metallopeptidase domain
MALSYTLRLVCLALASQAILQASAELLLWASAPLLLRTIAPLGLRLRERLLYLIQIAPFLAAGLLTALLCIPQYTRGETNLTAEEVGGLCLALTLTASACFAASALRTVSAVLRTARFRHACRRSGTLLDATARVPVYVADNASGIALIGLLRPIILIAPKLIEEPSASLDVVLDHERAHARQRDNWKLLTLRAIPRLNLRLASGSRNARTWLQLWQAAAELAADDDAVGNDPARALLLAQSLVTVARAVSPANVPLLQTALTRSQSEDLASRIDCLLHPRAAASRSPATVYALCAVLLTLGLLLTQLPASALHPLAERLLHLG